MHSNNIIAFDLDDTLVDCSHNARDKTAYLAKQFGCEFREEIFWRLFGKVSFEESVSILFPGINLRDYKAAYAALRLQFPYHPLIDVNRLFSELISYEFLFGILTNEESEKTLLKFECLDLSAEIRSRVSFILDGSSLPAKKPDPRSFDSLKSRFPGKRIFYCGDSMQDYMAAKKAGIDFIAVLTGVTSRKVFLEIGVPDNAILDSASFVIDYLLSISMSVKS